MKTKKPSFNNNPLFKFRVWNEVLKKYVDGQTCFLRADGDLFFLEQGKLSMAAPHYSVVSPSDEQSKDSTQ